MIIRFGQKVKKRVISQIEKIDGKPLDDVIVRSPIISHSSVIRTSDMIFVKEANIMYYKILHEMKDKHNMTKRRYAFLKKKLDRYKIYASVTSRNSLWADFEGDTFTFISSPNPSHKIRPIPDIHICDESKGIDKDEMRDQVDVKRAIEFMTRNSVYGAMGCTKDK